MPTVQELQQAWTARLPKGTRIKATFALTHESEREVFELVVASTCLVSIGSGEGRVGTMRPGLFAALDGIAAGLDGPKAYRGWTLDAASLTIEEAPKSATRAQVKALLAPLIVAAL